MSQPRCKYDLISQIAYTYTYEMKPYLDLLMWLLVAVKDSWQRIRIINALQGDKEGLFDIIHRSKSNYQKRSYQCIKMLVTLFNE